MAELAKSVSPDGRDGRNLAGNFARRAPGRHPQPYQRQDDVADRKHSGDGEFVPSKSMADFVTSLERPRRMIIPAKAGTATDAVIEELIPLRWCTTASIPIEITADVLAHADADTGKALAPDGRGCAKHSCPASLSPTLVKGTVENNNRQLMVRGQRVWLDGTTHLNRRIHHF
jgi:hypothetical protein